MAVHDEGPDMLAMEADEPPDSADVVGGHRLDVGR
jgi:hypothetical protein